MVGIASMRRWLLPASVVLNAFFVAALAVHLYTGPKPPDPKAAMEHLLADLPPSDQALLRAALDADLETLAQSRQAMDEIGEQLRGVLAREPFDKAAFRALLIQSDELHARFGHALTTTLPDVVEKMSAEGRRKMAASHFPGPPPPPPRP